MTRANQKILTDFFRSLVKIVSGGTSDSYAILVIKIFVKKHTREFPFAKHIHIDLEEIKISKEINSVNPKLVGKLLSKLINSLFSDLFKHLVKRKISVELYEDLENIGVKIE